MKTLKKLNIRVPENKSIVGNDDISYSKIYLVPLTTKRSPQNEIGMRVAEILIRNIESTEILQVERVVFESEFVVRDSTKVINNNM